MNRKKIAILSIIGFIVIGVSLLPRVHKSNLPLVAIANYGPHNTLDESIQGIKDELQHHGLIENKTIQYEIVDVGFDASLIPQMITHLTSHHPRVLVVTTTPVAQYAKGAIQNIPLIYNVITDPVAAGLIKKPDQSNRYITGSSDQQDLKPLFDFANRLLPHAKKVGVLYASAEANDIALVQMMKKSARASHLKIVAIPVDQTRDIPFAMQRFKNTVDFIYIGASGAIQPTLPMIVSESNKMGIPVFNMNEDAVKKDMVLASFGVDYHQVGINTGKLVIKALEGVPLTRLKPIYPALNGYHGFVSQKNALKFGIVLPKNLHNITVVE